MLTSFFLNLTVIDYFLCDLSEIALAIEKQIISTNINFKTFIFLIFFFFIKDLNNKNYFDILTYI